MAGCKLAVELAVGIVRGLAAGLELMIPGELLGVEAVDSAGMGQRLAARRRQMIAAAADQLAELGRTAVGIAEAVGRQRSAEQSSEHKAGPKKAEPGLATAFVGPVALTRSQDAPLRGVVTVGQRLADETAAVAACGLTRLEAATEVAQYAIVVVGGPGFEPVGPVVVVDLPGPIDLARLAVGHVADY